MCGITGAFRLDGRPGPVLAEHVLRAMTDIIAYRETLAASAWTDGQARAAA